MNPVPYANTRAVLTAIHRARASHPTAVLQRPHRDALRAELADDGLDLHEQTPVFEAIRTILATAEAFEREGAYGFIPLWADLIRAITPYLPVDVF